MTLRFSVFVSLAYGSNQWFQILSAALSVIITNKWFPNKIEITHTSSSWQASDGQ